MKTCSMCSEAKPLTEFYKANGGTSYFPECKVCNRIRARVWQAAKRASDPLYASDVRMRSVYGISLDEYDARLEAQGGGCAICGATESGGRGRRFSVDHDHACCSGVRSCGKCVRSLLCHGCNTGIGALGEDVDRLMAAAAYLLARQSVLVSF